MSKFKIGDRVKFHIEEFPEQDDTGTVCLGPFEVSSDCYWAKWDSDGSVQNASEKRLTLIEYPTKEELPSSFKIDVQAYADENNISLAMKEEETVEILGKKYRKSDVENALKNVKEKE